MPFAKDSTSFAIVLDSALEDKEIKEAAKKEGLRSDYLRSSVLEAEDRVWSAAAKELANLQTAKVQLDMDEHNFADLKDAKPARWVKYFWRTVGFYLPLLILLLWFDFGGLARRFIENRRTASIGFVGEIILLTVGLGVAVLRSRQRRAVLARMYTGLQIAEKRAAVAAMEEAARKALRGQGIIPELRQIISAQSEPSYNITLPELSAPGLAEVYNPQYEVPTAARERLDEMLRTMPGGSIGIAGPRGAGKTTLLSSFCSGQLDSLNGKPVLAVSAAAPVEYDARDFVLFLATALSLKILGKEKADAAYNGWDLGDSSADRSGARTGLFRFEVLLVLGVALLVLSLVLASFSVTAPPASLAKTRSDASQRAQGKDVGAPGSAALVAPSPSSPLTKASPSTAARHPGATTSTSEGATSDSRNEEGSFTLIRGYFAALGLKVSTLFKLGALLVGAYIILKFCVPFQRGSGLDFLRPSSSQASYERPTTVDPARTLIETKAADALREARFQQSFSEGWSGSLKLPIEIGLQRGVSLARKQRSFPEVVELYRSLVDAATTSGKVIIIGIDELDKISTTKTVYKFLNEIKVIFGLKNCFYLMSVSEDALTQFELRGLPVRDAFDSSFDGIVRVDYLQLQASQQLLQRRVIGLPVPFVALCHCLSGGLARDMIRTARDLLLLRRKDPKFASLAPLANSLIAADLEAKRNAIMRAADRFRTAPAYLVVTEQVSGVLQQPLESRDLFHLGRTLAKGVDQRGDANAQPGDEAQAALVKLAFQLVVYLFYAGTMLDFFKDDLDGQVLRSVPSSIELLSRARQGLAMSPQYSWSLISKFRKGHRMGAEAYPRLEHGRGGIVTSSGAKKPQAASRKGETATA